MKNSLLQPFTYFQEKQLLLFGLVIGLLSCLLQLITHTRIISILQLTALDQPPTFLQAICDYTISSIAMALALFIFGRIINPKTRWIDIFNTIIIARIPLFLPLFFDIKGYISNKQKALIQSISNPEAITNQMEGFLPILIFAIFCLLLLIVFGYYLYQGFKTATHLKKPGHIIIFIVLTLGIDLLTRLLTTLY
ncbi:hypothetical protein [Myroides sp. DW712]|uniref:hypothetical protein n=1 Tax=Myroides sp. DW712 TaxID=3389800 RepID=UPI00397AB79C